MTNGAIITKKILEIFQLQQGGEATTRTATTAIDTKQNKPSPQAACFN
jgi:hypothetical protein